MSERHARVRRVNEWRRERSEWVNEWMSEWVNEWEAWMSAKSRDAERLRGREWASECLSVNHPASNHTRVRVCRSVSAVGVCVCTCVRRLVSTQSVRACACACAVCACRRSHSAHSPDNGGQPAEFSFRSGISVSFCDGICVIFRGGMCVSFRGDMCVKLCGGMCSLARHLVGGQRNLCKHDCDY
jgi:hypothetical protein